MLNRDNIYNQIVTEKLIDNIRTDKETESVMEVLCNHTVDHWDVIIEELEKTFPYAAARLEIIDIVQMFLDCIVKPEGLDKERYNVGTYVEDSAEVIVCHLWDFLHDMDDCFRFWFK